MHFSVFNTASISNYLKMGIKKLNAWSPFLSAPKTVFWNLTLLFFISFIFWSAEIQFQPFYFHSTKVLRVRKLRSLTCYRSKIFRNILYMIKFVSRIKQLLTHLFQIQSFSALWNGLSNFKYWNITLIA